MSERRSRRSRPVGVDLRGPGLCWGGDRCTWKEAEGVCLEGLFVLARGVCLCLQEAMDTVCVCLCVCVCVCVFVFAECGGGRERWPAVTQRSG